MKINKITGLLFTYLIFALMIGCSKDYQVDFIFTGTIQEKLIEEDMLVLKEYDAPEGRREGNIYEIPVDDIEQYEVGQKLKVTVYSNTDEDVWDLDELRVKVK
jgi:hypothetical protein